MLVGRETVTPYSRAYQRRQIARGSVIGAWERLSWWLWLPLAVVLAAGGMFVAALVVLVVTM